MKYSFCLSSASGSANPDVEQKRAEQTGAAVAGAGHILVVATTNGLPLLAAQAAQAAGGSSIGYSPATNRREHIRKYRLPIAPFDYIHFSGSDPIGRDSRLVAGADALLLIAEANGTHDFMTAFETDIVIGVLENRGLPADLFRGLVSSLEPDRLDKRVVFATEAKALVGKVIACLEKSDHDLTDAEIDAHSQAFSQSADA